MLSAEGYSGLGFFLRQNAVRLLVNKGDGNWSFMCTHWRGGWLMKGKVK